jgi:hypothetical protein
MKKKVEEEEIRTDYDRITEKRCTCVHEFQDKRYGKGMRVHNKMDKGWNCTVCGNSNNLK